LGETSANTRHSFEVARDFLVCAWIVKHDLGFIIYGGRQGTAGFLDTVHQPENFTMMLDAFPLVARREHGIIVQRNANQRR
jgi:hypothetical protein